MVFRAIRTGEGRRKKLIAALLLSIDPTFAQVFNCATCEFEERAARGCAERSEVEVWSCPVCFDCSPFCAPYDPIAERFAFQMRFVREDSEAECTSCQGSNQSDSHRCPRALVESTSYWLLPFFLDYYHGLQESTPQWPFPGGRMAQPVWLVRAFDLLTTVAADKGLGMPEKKNGK